MPNARIILQQPAGNGTSSPNACLCSEISTKTLITAGAYGDQDMEQSIQSCFLDAPLLWTTLVGHTHTHIVFWSQAI